MSSAGGTGAVLQQVNQLWSMMDELSLRDPGAYRRLVRAQLEEGAARASPPELDSCLRADMLEPHTGPLYLNICSWRRVPAPQGPGEPVPLCAGRLERAPGGGPGVYSVLDVAVNPAELDGQGDRTELHALALGLAQEQLGLRLSPQYTVITRGPDSAPADLSRRLGFQQWPPHTSTQPPAAGQTPAGLLQQLASLRSEEQRDDEPAATVTRGPAGNKHKGLVQVVSSSYVQPQKPEHRLEVRPGAAGVPGGVELTVELPQVRSVSECQLRVSKDDVLLEVEDVYYLLLDFPVAVDEDTASAVFDRKTRRLALKVDVL